MGASGSDRVEMNDIKPSEISKHCDQYTVCLCKYYSNRTMPNLIPCQIIYAINKQEEGTPRSTHYWLTELHGISNELVLVALRGHPRIMLLIRITETELGRRAEERLQEAGTDEALTALCRASNKLPAAFELHGFGFTNDGKTFTGRGLPAPHAGRRLVPGWPRGRRPTRVLLMGSPHQWLLHLQPWPQHPPLQRDGVRQGRAEPPGPQPEGLLQR